MPISSLDSSIFIAIRWADLISIFFGTYSGTLRPSGSGDSSVLIEIFCTSLAFQDRTPSPLPSPVLFFSCRLEASARGRWYRSGQGLRRGILLGLRETAKSIAEGSELASGSDSRPCRNNAVSRSPSSNHPSSAAARPDATFLWLTLPTDRKKHAVDGSGLGVLS